jgi:uncharacterized protein (DUF305 family)
VTATDSDSDTRADAETAGTATASPPVAWRLPWVRTVVLIAVVAFVAGVIGWFIGKPADASFNSVDVGFLADMTEHHSGAITLGFAYLPKNGDAVLSSMARDIITDQSQEIGTMNGLLGKVDDASTVGDGVSMDWMGHTVASADMPGLATNADYARLASESGAVADDDFSRLMINHHEAGAEMADYAARFGSNDKVRALARSMAKVQRFEISEMNLRREKLGIAVVPTTRLIPSSG